MKQTLNNIEDIVTVHYYLFIRKKGKLETPGKLEKNIFKEIHAFNV